METAIKYLATFVATAVLANGEYEAQEQEQVKALAGALEIEEAALVEAVANEVAHIEGLEGDALQDYLEAAGAEVADEDLETIYQIAVSLTLADGIFSYDEADNLLAIADALGVDHTYALMLIADSINDAEELVVDFEDDDE